MTNHAWEILGLPPNSTDDAIRQRYLELVRQFPPERDPGRFAEIRAAYEALRDLTQRLQSRFFQRPAGEDLDSWIEEIRRRSPRRRLGVAELLQWKNNPS